MGRFSWGGGAGGLGLIRNGTYPANLKSVVSVASEDRRGSVSGFRGPWDSRQDRHDNKTSIKTARYTFKGQINSSFYRQRNWLHLFVQDISQYAVSIQRHTKPNTQYSKTGRYVILLSCVCVLHFGPRVSLLIFVFYHQFIAMTPDPLLS